MHRWIKNERGFSMIEVMVIIAVLGVLVVMLVEGFGSVPSDTASDQNVNTVTSTAYEEKVPNESVSSGTEDFAIVFVLGFLGLIVGIGIICGLAIFLMNLREKQNQLPKNLDKTLRFMLRKKPKKLFVLQKGTSDVHSYQYTVSKYEWLLDATASQLDIKMKKKEKQVLHITYDKTTENFTRKNVKAHVFSDEKTLKQLDKLIDAIIATEWNQQSTYNLLAESDDLDIETPQQGEETIHTVITDPMLELEAHIENIMEDKETKEKFQAVIENMNRLQHYQTDMDIETKHTIEYSLTNDLNRLLSLYEDLNEDQKETMADEIQQRLDLMNEKVEQIQTKLDEKKASEIKKALHLFDQRYQL